MLGTFLVMILVLLVAGELTCLAIRQWVRILSKRLHGADPSDCGRAPVNSPYLTGVRASQRSAVHSFAMGYGLATVSIKHL